MSPPKAILKFPGRGALLVMRPWANALVFFGALVVSQEKAVITAPIRDVRISRLRDAVGAFAIGDAMPVSESNHFRAAGTRSFKGAFILLCAVHVIGKLVVHINMIELPGRLIVLRAPGLPAIGGDGRAAVVTL